MKKPRILIIANVLNPSHDVMGFLPGWVAALRAQGAAVSVVVSGGPGSRAGRLWRVWRALVLARAQYDCVFVVMAPTWAMLTAPLARLMGKRVFLWYAVWKGTWKLRLATLMVNGILCSVPESFPFPSAKVHAVGQAIDTSRFSPEGSRRTPGQILCLGRISAVKKIHLLLEAVASLPEPPDARSIIIAGSAVSEADRAYERSLRETSARRGLDDVVVWLGRVGHDHVHEFYQRADIAVNMTPAGSFDKAMLEAMASGTILVASNPAVLRLLPSAVAVTVGFKQDDASGLAATLSRVAALADAEKDDIRSVMRAVVVEHHSITQWAHNVTEILG